MKNIKKENIYKTPEGYFENLPDQILNACREDNTPFYRLMTTWATAAAVVVLGFAIFIYSGQQGMEDDLQADVGTEIELYINAGYWEAEDLLSGTDNPDEILDMIILSEWADHDFDDEMYLEEYWF